MDGSVLARLSGELRNQIYHEYIKQYQLIEVDIDGNTPLVHNHVNAFIATCRHQIR